MYGSRSLTPAMEAALWRNVRRGGRYLSRRLHACGLEIQWAATSERVTVREGGPTARLSGAPGELLLYVFGRQAAAQASSAERRPPLPRCVARTSACESIARLDPQVLTTSPSQRCAYTARSISDAVSVRPAGSRQRSAYSSGRPARIRAIRIRRGTPATCSGYRPRTSTVAASPPSSPVGGLGAVHRLPAQENPCG